MVRRRRGFTLIEVSLFLVITGALFVSVTIGVQNSIYQQRLNDSVQNFADFLRNLYSEVLNVENIGGGRSEKAIYGKLVTFGETTDLSGAKVTNTGNTIFVYDVIGNVNNTGSGNILNVLNELNANVIMVENKAVRPTGIIESYTPKWAAQIEPPCIDDSCSYDPYVGALLIARHPNSGTVYTYSMIGQTIEVNELTKGVESLYESEKVKESQAENDQEKADAGEILDGISKGTYSNILSPYLVPSSDADPHFKIQDVDFCVNPTAGESNLMRRDVRILAGARNSSGVEIINDEDNLCTIK